MWQLMNKIMLSCHQATELMSVKRYRKISALKSMQLKMHLMACHYCRKFEAQNNFIDHSMDRWFDPENIHPTEHITEAQKTVLHKVVDEG